MRRRTERPQDGPRTAIGYVRVSTEGQAAQGVSLDAQRARIEAWATADGCRMGDVHVDAGLSGGRADNRPALQAALTQVCRERGALVVYSLSRLASPVHEGCNPHRRAPREVWRRPGEPQRGYRHDLSRRPIVLPPDGRNGRV